MGSFEARYGNLGFLADAIHLPVSTKITTRDIFFQGGNAALKADTGTGIVLYRFLQDPVQFADGGLGFRAWGFSSNLTLNPGLLQGIALNRTGSWTDPLIGGRYHRDLGNGFGSDRLWRCRRLWGRCAYRLASARHCRLFPQPILGPAPRLSQPQFQHYGKRRQVWLQRPFERADHCRHLPFLTHHRKATPDAHRARIAIELERDPRHCRHAVDDQRVFSARASAVRVAAEASSECCNRNSRSRSES